MARRLRYVPTIVEHLRHVADNMRFEDVEELRVSSGETPLRALMNSFDVSDQTITGLTPSGEAVGIFGIGPICRVTGKGAPWMLGTDKLLKYRRELLLDPPAALEGMLDLYPRLENYIHVKNKKSVRWLKRLGFKMDKPITLPTSGEDFMRFYMTREA